jgi:type II secretory pathway predicted ATPase ExeA
MIPTTTTTTDSPAEQVIALAQQIHAWQRDPRNDLTDSEMLRRYKGLGSDKTFKRLVRGDAAELDAEGWLAKYSAVWRLIESLDEIRANEEDDILTLSGVNAVRRALLPVFKERDNNRLVFVQGDTGTGKSTIIKWLSQTYGDKLVTLECFKAWGDNPNAFLADVMLALGLTISSDCSSAAQKQRAIIGDLRASRRCLLLDEAHHMGPRCLDVLKALINQTPGEFVAFAMPTLWNRLKQSAYEECRQLTGNRLAERVSLELKVKDIETLLKQRLGLNGEASTAAKLLFEPAGRHGNLAFIRDVVTRVRKAAKDTEPSVELITQAAADEIASR